VGSTVMVELRSWTWMMGWTTSSSPPLRSDRVLVRRRAHNRGSDHGKLGVPATSGVLGIRLEYDRIGVSERKESARTTARMADYGQSYTFALIGVTSPTQGCLLCVNNSRAGCVLSCIPPVCKMNIRGGVQGCKKTFDPYAHLSINTPS